LANREQIRFSLNHCGGLASIGQSTHVMSYLLTYLLTFFRNVKSRVDVKLNKANMQVSNKY